jgi:hypothetical protein
MFNAICFPVSCGLTIMLFFYDDFFQRESRAFKYFHHIETQRNKKPFLRASLIKIAQKFSDRSAR